MRVGQEVLCIDGTLNDRVMHYYQQWPVEGKIYTVKRIEGSLDGEPRVLLEEISNKPIYVEAIGGKAEPGFAASRFKPLVEDSAEYSESKEEVILN